jgi:hypothetical protein
MASASLRISTFYLVIVISPLFLGLFSARATFAEDVSEIAENKEIDAKAYDLKTIRPSKSGRVYLFQKMEEGFPVDGKIFLLRQGDQPVMAFRVLKSYPDTKRLAAKKLLPYEGFAKLEKNSEYRAYEKVGDKVKPVPPSPEDLKDLKELESGSLEELPSAPPGEGAPPAEVTPPPAENPATTELHEPAPGEALAGSDAGDIPPPPDDEKLVPIEEKPAEKPVEAPPEEPRDENLEMKDSEEEDEADEVGSYFPNFFTMETGLLLNGTVPGPNPKFGAGLLYSRTFGRSVGSAFAAEGGLFYYQSSGAIAGATISTTIIPIQGTLRYQHRYGELTTGYVYGGLQYPIVASNVGATKHQLGQIMVPSPAFGVGLFIQTGPNWYMRFNFGYDVLASIGVTLRF